MTETEFITLVSRMREAQRLSITIKTKQHLERMRDLERQVDEEIARIKAFTNPPCFQPSLFQQPL